MVPCPQGMTVSDPMKQPSNDTLAPDCLKKMIVEACFRVCCCLFLSPSERYFSGVPYRQPVRLELAIKEKKQQL